MKSLESQAVWTKLFFSPLYLFLSEEKCPVVLRRLFEDPMTELWLAFVQGNLAIFHEGIKMVEGQDRCAVESAAILRNVQAKLVARHDNNFVPVLVRGLLRNLEENGTIT